VIDERGATDAGDDRERLLEPRRENEREELSLVTNLSKCDHSDRNEESFHRDFSTAAFEDDDHSASLGRRRGAAVKGLAKPGDCLRHGRTAKHVDADLFSRRATTPL
jgi:hypothetical protein